MSWKKFVACGDSHGNLVCEKTKRKFLDFVAEWKPHYRIHLGDFVDAPSLRKGCSIEESSLGISNDFQAGIEFIREYRPNYLTLGNHDDRIWLHSTHCANGILREHCAELAEAAEQEFRKLKIQWVPYHVSRYLQMPEGGPKLLHGFLAGMNPAKAHFERFGSCLFGHVHAPSSYIAKHIDQGQAYALGCMADIGQMDYAKKFPNMLGWRRGWIYGMINSKTGAWNAWHVTEDNGEMISPMGIL